MVDAKYQVGAGPLRIEIVSGFAHPGTYRLFLWEANRNSSQKIGQGNFTSSEDDAFQLDSSPVQDGRTLQCLANVNPLGDGCQFAVTMTVSQNGAVIGSDTVTGSASLPTVTLQIFLRLVGV
jgi:hypothetical protein